MKRFTGIALVMAAFSCQGLDDPADEMGTGADDSSRPADDTEPPDGVAGAGSATLIGATGDVAGNRATHDAATTPRLPDSPSGADDGTEAHGTNGSAPGADDGADPGNADAGSFAGDDGNADGAANGGATSSSADGAGGATSVGGTAAMGGARNAGAAPGSAGAPTAGATGGASSGGAKNGGAANVAGSASNAAGAPAGSAGAPSLCESVVTQHGVTGAEHVATCSPVTYETNPPCEGNHYDDAAAFTTYDEPIPHGFVVHSLEHGGIAVWYNCPAGCPAEVAKAQAWIDALPEDVRCAADGIPRRILMVPNPKLPTRWAASAWGWTLTAPCFDPAAFTAFYKAHYDKTSEVYCRGTWVTPKTCPKLPRP